LATYEVSGCPRETRLCFRQIETRLYFAGRPVELTDRVGSSGSYFPYGEERSS
jgi:hypothetical protein